LPEMLIGRRYLPEMPPLLQNHCLVAKITPVFTVF